MAKKKRRKKNQDEVMNDFQRDAAIYGAELGVIMQVSTAKKK